MLQFEEYLQEFNSTTNIWEFLFNLGIAAILALILRWFYIRYGSSISNRPKFAMNFIPLALTTLLIITVIKSSLALSLGLIGALSIVRFRAAIKDPEELTYLFLTIGIGLVAGANKPLLAAIGVACILPIIYFSKRMNLIKFREEEKMYININTDQLDLEKISSILTQHFDYVELKRMDQTDSQLDVSFICNVEGFKNLEEVRTKLTGMSQNTSISFVDKPEILL